MKQFNDPEQSKTFSKPLHTYQNSHQYGQYNDNQNIQHSSNQNNGNYNQNKQVVRLSAQDPHNIYITQQQQQHDMPQNYYTQNIRLLQPQSPVQYSLQRPPPSPSVSATPIPTPTPTSSDGLNSYMPRMNSGGPRVLPMHIRVSMSPPMNGGHFPMGPSSPIAMAMGGDQLGGQGVQGGHTPMNPPMSRYPILYPTSNPTYHNTPYIYSSNLTLYHTDGLYMCTSPLSSSQISSIDMMQKRKY